MNGMSLRGEKRRFGFVVVKVFIRNLSGEVE